MISHYSTKSTLIAYFVGALWNIDEGSLFSIIRESIPLEVGIGSSI